MSYRDAETAFRERAEDLEREIAAFDAEIAEKGLILDDLTSTTARLEERLEREGPGGGETGARLLRIPLVAGTMLAIGCVALLFQFFIAIFIRGHWHDVVPTYVIMSGPTILGTAVLVPFRSALRTEFRTGFVLTAMLVLFFVLGALGVLHDV